MGKKKPATEAQEWTGASRDTFYAHLQEGRVAKALALVEAFPGLKANDLSPTDKRALASLEEKLAANDRMQQTLALALLSKSPPVARAARHLLSRIGCFDAANLLPALQEFDAEFARENQQREIETRKMAIAYFGDGIAAGEIAEFVKSFMAKEGWRFSTARRVFVSSIVAALHRFSTPPSVSEHFSSLVPEHAALWNQELAGGAAPSHTGSPRRKQAHTSCSPSPMPGKGQGGSPAKMLSDSSLFEALLSGDEAVRRDACRIVEKLPCFQTKEFLVHARMEVGRHSGRSQAEIHERLGEALLAIACHVDNEALGCLADWEEVCPPVWDLFAPLWKFHAAKIGIDGALSAVRGIEERSPDMAWHMSNAFHAALLEQDPGLGLGIASFGRDRFVDDTGPILEPLALFDSEPFGSRPGLAPAKHEADPQGWNSMWALHQSSARSSKQDRELAVAVSLLHGEGCFDRLEKELWPKIAERVLLRCKSGRPDRQWRMALGTFLLCSPKPDADVVARYQEVAPSFREEGFTRSTLLVSESCGRLPVLKNWWLPYFESDLQTFVTEAKEGRSSDRAAWNFHGLDGVLEPLLRHSQLFDSSAFRRAVDDILEVLPGCTMAEKLERGRIDGGQWELMAAAARVATDDEAAALLLAPLPALPHAALAWRLRESRSDTVREFLGRWTVVKGEGSWRTLQSEAMRALIDIGPYAHLIADRLASSLASSSDDEFDWAFRLVFERPDRLLPSGEDFLGFVQQRLFGVRKRKDVLEAVERTALLGRYGRASKDRVFAALEEVFQLDDPTAWRKAADAMREFRKELPHLVLANPGRVRDLIARDPKKHGPIFKGLVE